MPTSVCEYRRAREVGEVEEGQGRVNDDGKSLDFGW